MKKIMQIMALACFSAFAFSACDSKQQNQHSEMVEADAEITSDSLGPNDQMPGSNAADSARGSADSNWPEN